MSERPEPEELPDAETSETEAEGVIREQAPRIPPDEPGDYEGKWFMVANGHSTPPLIVTLSSGEVAKHYAPVALVARMAERVGAVLRDFGGGFEPMLLGAFSGASMRLVFVDPEPEEAQARLPVEITLSQAQKVATLLDLEGDALFARALEIGAPMRRYAELAHAVQSEGIQLRWEARDAEPRTLTPTTAGRQEATLTASPPTQDRELTVNGVLYRVITEETKKGFLGSVGIHLHSWSTLTPKGGRKPILFYEDQAIEGTIRSSRLIGEPVEARLVVRQPVPGTSYERDRVDLVLVGIERGATEESRFGTSFTGGGYAEEDEPDEGSPE